MITAQLFGGPRDGEIVTVAAPFAPIPVVLDFPAWVDPPKLLADAGKPLGETSAAELGRITTVRYRRRPLTRPGAPIVYDLVRDA